MTLVCAGDSSQSHAWFCRAETESDLTSLVYVETQPSNALSSHLSAAGLRAVVPSSSCLLQTISTGYSTGRGVSDAQRCSAWKRTRTTPAPTTRDPLKLRFAIRITSTESPSCAAAARRSASPPCSMMYRRARSVNTSARMTSRKCWTRGGRSAQPQRRRRRRRRRRCPRCRWGLALLRRERRPRLLQRPVLAAKARSHSRRG
jgi:hypothetical protein